MDWSIIAQLLGAGGVVYLLIDKFFIGKKEKIEANKDIIGNGVQVVDLYNQIKDIVNEEVAMKTKPLEDKIDNLTSMLEQWGCSRPKEECDQRLPMFYSGRIKHE